MRPTDAIIRDTYQQNQKTFSSMDRSMARTAWDIYMFEINGSGLRWEFDYYPDNMHELPQRSRRHLEEIDRLKAQVERFAMFIEILQRFVELPAVQLNPQRRYTNDAPETIARTLDPQAVPAYRGFHSALVRYLDELGKKSPDWSVVNERALEVAYSVNPKEWRKTGVSAPEHGVLEFDTRWYLEAVLPEPKK